MCCLVVLISRPRSMWAVRGGGWYQSAGRPVFRSLIKTSPDIRSTAGGFINCNPTDRLSCDQPGPVAQFYWGNKPDLMGKQTIITTTTTFTPSLTSVHICSSWPDWHIDLQSNHHLLSHSSLLLWEDQVDCSMIIIVHWTYCHLIKSFRQVVLKIFLFFLPLIFKMFSRENGFKMTFSNFVSLKYFSLILGLGGLGTFQVINIIV